jgi:hypothetical protein
MAKRNPYNKRHDGDGGGVNVARVAWDEGYAALAADLIQTGVRLREIAARIRVGPVVPPESYALSKELDALAAFRERGK